MDQLSTCDLYEAGYYLLNECTLEGVETSELNGKLSCRLILVGENTGELQTLYFHNKAQVNLFDFRRMYSHLNKVLYEAKKAYKKEKGGRV
jgi:hypothetical protein